jgi:acetyl-CoA carboxylase carboxyltransferase component
MCGKAYDPRLIVAWPWSDLAVMGGAQSAKVLAQIQESTLKKQGKEISDVERQEILDSVAKKYKQQTESTYAAARLWTDAIIDPTETRTWISMGIEAANQSPITEKFNLGIIQV